MERYEEKFAFQWKKLCNEFAVFTNKRSKNGLDADKLNEWYRKAAYRWHSNTATESLMLDQQNNPAMKAALLRAIDDFSFAQVDPQVPSEKTVLAGAGGVSAAAALVIYNLIPKTILTGWIVRASVAFVGAGLIMLLAAKSLENKQKDDDEARRKAYREQLRAYGEHLKKLCK